MKAKQLKHIHTVLVASEKAGYDKRSSQAILGKISSDCRDLAAEILSSQPTMGHSIDYAEHMVQMHRNEVLTTASRLYNGSSAVAVGQAEELIAEVDKRCLL